MNSTKPTCILCKTLQSICYLIILCSYLTHVNCEQTNGTKTCAEVYEKGVEAYLDNKFQECVSYLENALVKYREYSKTLLNCRLKCRDEAEQSKPLNDIDIENLLFFEKILKNTLCLVKCKTTSTLNTEKYNINEELEHVFENRKPYEYLHLCYFQVKDLQKAASAAFTYLISHPEDKTMLATLKYYSSFDGVDMNEIVNYEARDYVYLYSHGAAAYEKKDWKSVINNMEESLTDFLQADEECRAQCEGPFDHGWLPDFVPSIANHFTYCLKCKNRCFLNLNSINGEKYEDLLPSHYHYLQYAYFKVGSLKEACQAVASFLLFSPEDKTMIDNKEYYLKLPNVNPDFFKPRSEALKYIQRKTYEDKLLKYIEKEFQADKLVVEDFSKKQKSKLEIVKSGPDLKGAYRFVAEGLLWKNQCRSLVDIIKKFSIAGDGYDTGSPHTKMETFEGMSLERAILLTYYGLLKIKYLKMIVEASEEAKQTITRYFRVEKPLYFTYTHLVCRSALKGNSKNRTDLSHEIHADNCNIYPDGVCEKQPPSYIWRDYSAIIYLNNEFDGGEFFFSSNTQPESIETTVMPACGRMVGFSSGSENLHGVNAVRKGSRCALALWFTFDEIYREKVRDWVYDLLDER